MSFKKHLSTAIATGLILGLTPTYAETPDYWLVHVSEDHAIFYFIDVSTLTRDGPFRSVWLSEITAGQSVVKHSLRRKMIQTLFNCAINSSREERVVTFDAKAATLADHSRDDSTFKQIASDSIDAVELEFVCANSEHWRSRKGWTEIDATPEKLADDDNKAFRNHATP